MGRCELQPHQVVDAVHDLESVGRVGGAGEQQRLVRSLRTFGERHRERVVPRRRSPLDREPHDAVGPVHGLAVAHDEDGSGRLGFGGQDGTAANPKALTTGQVLVERVLEADVRGALGIRGERAVRALVLQRQTRR